jgi:hypothetical protein
VKAASYRTETYNMFYSWLAVILPMRVWLRLHANQPEPDIARRLRDNGLASGGDRDAKLQRLYHHYSRRIKVVDQKAVSLMLRLTNVVER